MTGLCLSAVHYRSTLARHKLLSARSHACKPQARPHASGSHYGTPTSHCTDDDYPVRTPAPSTSFKLHSHSEDSGNTAKVWLITGTSSGLGRRLVSSVLARGDRVIATARSLSKLQGALTSSSSRYPNVEHSDNLRLLQLDVTEGGDAIKVKVDDAVAMWGRIDVLVNNAGFGRLGILEEGATALLREQFETNVFGLMDVTMSVLPHMRARREGTIVNIGSRSAWKPEIPGLGRYAASKAAVHALTENLTAELAPFNIRVLLVSPGAFRTEGIYSYPYHTTNPIPAYDALRNASNKRVESVPGTEGGDPWRAMEAVVDVVRGEGVARGRGWPGTLVLGADAERDVREKCGRVVAGLDVWGDVARGVIFED